MKQRSRRTARLKARSPLERPKPAAETRETESIRLSIDGQRQIAAAILDPPAATPALNRAARRYRKLVGMA